MKNRLLIMGSGEVEHLKVESDTDILLRGSVSVGRFKEIVKTVRENSANEYILRFSLGEDCVLIENIGKTVNQTEKEATTDDRILYKDRQEIINWYL